ncbi:RNA-binding domain-containing protein [Hesseltinella vesiculosa]|uniref:RNA-binding domain-containing protein n=1 Tax=Hesseltinella vesiculosa TaxID=101127 RepID=A0A1X2GLT0_9FUNG|nr:RNA-binding domain-containing protein [Hesseltinella vesiculosa]
MRKTLFIVGFDARTRAVELASEFERYGPLIRCDIPAPKHNSKPYAFVEFEYPDDADAAFKEMHGKRFEGATLSVQWARQPPSSLWRLDGPPPPPRYAPPPPPPPRQQYRRSYGYRSRSRSPGYRHRRSVSPHPPPPANYYDRNYYRSPSPRPYPPPSQYHHHHRRSSPPPPSGHPPSGGYRRYSHLERYDYSPVPASRYDRSPPPYAQQPGSPNADVKQPRSRSPTPGAPDNHDSASPQQPSLDRTNSTPPLEY